MTECNMVLGRFQPFTLGHVKMIKEVYSQNSLPVCVCMVSNTKFDSKHPFSDELIKKEFDICLKHMKEFLDVIILPGGDFGKWFNEMQNRGYQPQLWGCGSDRVKSYQRFATNPKYHEMFNLPETFDVYEIERTDDDISATKVRQAIIDDDIETFKSMMPTGSEKLWENFRTSIKKITESNKHMKSLSQFIKEALSAKFCIPAETYFVDGDAAKDIVTNAFSTVETLWSETHKGEITQYTAEYIRQAIEDKYKLSDEEYLSDYISYLEQYLENIPSKEREALEDEFINIISK